MSDYYGNATLEDWLALEVFNIPRDKITPDIVAIFEPFRGPVEDSIAAWLDSDDGEGNKLSWRGWGRGYASIAEVDHSHLNTNISVVTSWLVRDGIMKAESLHWAQCPPPIPTHQSLRMESWLSRVFHLQDLPKALVDHFESRRAVIEEQLANVHDTTTPFHVPDHDQIITEGTILLQELGIFPDDNQRVQGTIVDSSDGHQITESGLVWINMDPTKSDATRTQTIGRVNKEKSMATKDTSPPPLNLSKIGKQYLYGDIQTDINCQQAHIEAMYRREHELNLQDGDCYYLTFDGEELIGQWRAMDKCWVSFEPRDDSTTIESSGDLDAIGMKVPTQAELKELCKLRDDVIDALMTYGTSGK